MFFDDNMINITFSLIEFLPHSDIMKRFSLFEQLLLMIVVAFMTIMGCASSPTPLVPVSSQIIGLAVIPQTKVAENALGHKEPRIVQNHYQQEELFSVLEINRDHAPVTSFDDYVTHDFVVKWKIRGQNKMDRSQLFLRMNKPRTLVYESDHGGFTKKYVFRVGKEDAKIVWNTIGITPPGL